MATPFIRRGGVVTFGDTAGIFGIGALVFTLLSRAAIAVLNGDLRMRGAPAMAGKA